VSIELLQSELLARVPGVAHGFTTRRDGHSHGVYSSLNLSGRVGDEKSAVDANRQAVLARLGCPQGAMVMLKQIHGEEVREVTRWAGRSIEADGMWTRDRQAVLAVLVADCVPVLMSTPDGKAVAAVHAGWRGTRARIVARTVERLASAGYAADSLLVALGPAIGPCCFTIADDTGSQLRQAYPSTAAVRQDAGRMVADLWQLNVEALIESGVRQAHIDVLRRCTSCEAEMFFSHRRDHGSTGRQAGLIVAA
jgi:polyphenol oxidase